MYEAIDDSGRVVKLRKRYQCEWCSEWLEAGEQVITRTYKWEGVLRSARMHRECYKAMISAWPDMWNGEFSPGEQGRGCLAGNLMRRTSNES